MNNTLTQVRAHSLKRGQQIADYVVGVFTGYKTVNYVQQVGNRYDPTSFTYVEFADGGSFRYSHGYVVTIKS